MARESENLKKIIPITRPFLGEEEVEAASEVIRSGWVTQGPKVKEFEDAFATFVGSKHACAVSNCTTALHLALLAVGVKPGDIVVTVSHSFIATANAARYCGGESVFIDIEKDGFNMCPESLKEFLLNECEKRPNGLFYKNVNKLIRSESPLSILVGEDKGKIENCGRIAAILVVHQMGIPSDLKAILPIAHSHKIPVVEDAAFATGSEISLDEGKTWEKIGKPHADVACFSFHPRKPLVTGEGGMLTTSNEEYDALFRLLRHQGMAVSDLVRHESKKIIIEDYIVTGYNYRMTDIQAAIGIEQLKRLPEMIRRKKEAADFYSKNLSDISWLKTFKESSFARCNWQNYPVVINERSPMDRNSLMQHFLDQGVSTRPCVMNAHRELPYKTDLWFLPNSDKARDQGILLPLFYQITQEDLEKVVEVFRNV
ncbi:MAG: DegT/DnrJ/EryC1/StrS family aminotransferase [Candidatus Omnitrophica bacterium]|nr:DegT/DnrJ/EryC1/StrS family aminotransferase [Candidatus Omnitrophota bacterium]